MSQCKYNMREHQISYDNGVTWSSLEVIKGELIEYESSDCPDSGSEITKWVDLEGDYICEDNHKYKKQILYVSYNNGATWYIYFPTVYRKGEYIGIDDELCSYKFEGHYNAKHDPIKIVKCNGNPILTSAETAYYISQWAITSANIGNCVTSIGEKAFYECRDLTSVTISNSVTSISDYAFYNCNHLPSITIPNSITSIGNSAFYDCIIFTSITIPDSVTSIGNYAFRLCNRLTSATIGSGVTTIGDYAFDGCYRLISASIASGSIGNYAFRNCSGLTSVTIGSGVTSIGDYAFENCKNLPSITIGSGVTSIGTYAFHYCSGFTSVMIPSSVTRVGFEAFAGCRSLTSVVISDLAAWCRISFSIDSNPLGIAHRLFLGNNEITNLVIPSSVTSIGNYAFEYCRSLTSVTIPNSVTSIGRSAFRGCSNLTSITVEAITPPTLGNNPFNDTNNCPIYVPAESVSTFKSAWSEYSDRISSIP